MKWVLNVQVKIRRALKHACAESMDAGSLRRICACVCAGGGLGHGGHFGGSATALLLRRKPGADVHAQVPGMIEIGNRGRGVAGDG